MPPIYRDNKGKETYRWYHFPDDEPCPPVFVPITVRATWTAGNFFERIPSSEFWVELVTAGDMTFVQDTTEYLVRAGEIFLPRKGCVHRFSTGPSGFAAKRSVRIDGPMLDETLSCVGIGACDHIPLRDAEDRAAVLRLFKSCDRLLERKPPGFTIGLAMNAMGLLVKLGEAAAQRFTAPINRALHFMRQNLDRQLTDREIAAVGGFSVTHFHRLFKAAINTSPMRHFLKMKTEHAKGILALSSLSMKEAAYALGYEEPAYFSEVFKRITGVSPLAFRNEQRKRISNVKNRA
jgi:AraC-like DNA-binding protein